MFKLKKGTNLNELTLFPKLFDTYPSMVFWRINYQIENSQSKKGLASLVLIKNQPPQNGVCSISPNNGISLQTPFLIECVNWIDLDGSIIRYEYFGKIYHFKKP